MTKTLNPPSIKVVSPADAKAAIDSGRAVLVDVREPDEHAAERIAGAQLLPLSKFDPKAVALGGKRQVIFHCRSGKRSAEAARLASDLAAQGVEVCSLDGGIVAWRAAGHAVASTAGAPRMSVMRQVQVVIGVGVLAGTAAGYFVDARLLVVPAFLAAGLIFAGVSGTCGLASLLSMMPWNKFGSGGESCAVPQKR